MKLSSLCANEGGFANNNPLVFGVRLLPTIFTAFCLYTLGFSCTATAAANDLQQTKTPERFHYHILKKIAHDRDHFTQGLSFHNGYLYESTGEYGKSRVFKYAFPSMRIVAQHTLKDRYFGEGLDIVGNQVFQLTWKRQRGFVYTADNLTPLNTFKYRGQGWGLCSDGEHLIMSNGSAELSVYRVKDFQQIQRILVTESGQPVQRLNELEWVKGKIFANVWQQDRVLIIDPHTGEVTGTVDLSGLLTARDRDYNTDVLNGIAYNPADDSLWVTGKRWPWLYQIELVSDNRMSTR